MQFVNRLSIRTKFLFLFITFVTLVLILTNILLYFSTEKILFADQLGRSTVLSNQITSTVQAYNNDVIHTEELLGEELRFAAITAQYSLDKDAANVTNDQLKRLSKELGVSDITLFHKKGDDIVGVKSSDPHEIGLSTKNWEFWFSAFQELFSNQNVVSVEQGQKLDHFWSGPIDYSTSNPSQIDKWGYYYDGTTNYILCIFFKNVFLTKFPSNNPESILTHIASRDTGILEVTAFNPESFGKTTILGTTSADSKYTIRLRNNPVLFGTNSYETPNDASSITEAFQKGTTIQKVTTVNGKKVLKTFIPVPNGNLIIGLKKTYVLCLVWDYQLIQNVLNKEFDASIFTSIAILLVVMIISYFSANSITKPLMKIKKKLDEAAYSTFDTTIQLNRADEIGDLAQSVNTVFEHVQAYKRELQQSLAAERISNMTYLGLIASGLIHELRSSANSLSTIIKYFPNTAPDEALEHMKVASNHINSVLNNFSDFIKNGKTNIQICDIFTILNEAIEILEPIAATKNIELISESDKDPIFVEVDPDKVRQVFINLIKNGIDAIDKNTHRKIFISSQFLNGNVNIYIEDTGCGIPAEKLDSIFKPFQSSKSGFGLGLSLSRFIVLSNRGSISIDRSDSNGTKMKVSFPIVEDQKQETLPSHDQTPTG